MSQENASNEGLPSDEEIRDLSAFGRALEQLTLKKRQLRDARDALVRAQQKSDADKDLIRLRLGDVRDKIEQINRRIDVLYDTFRATEAPGEDEVKAIREAVRRLRNKVAAAQTGVELLTLAVSAIEETLPSGGDSRGSG